MVDKKEGETSDATEETEEEQSEEETTNDEQQEETTTEEETTSDDDSTDEPTLADVMALLKSEREERKKLESKLNSVVSGSKDLAATQLISLKADIKAMGLNPDELIVGLNTKQATQVLKSIKTQQAGKRSLSSTPSKTGKPGGSQTKRTDEVFLSALKFLGMDENTYLELSGKKKGE